MVDRLIAKLNLRDELTTTERDLLASVLEPQRHHRSGVDLIKPGGRPDHATLLLSGFCGRYGILRDGRRVFLSVHVAGDFIDLFGLLIPQLDYGVVALTGRHIRILDRARLMAAGQFDPTYLRPYREAV